MATKNLLSLARKMLLPQGTRGYQTMVMVGSANPQGDPSLLATLFVDEKSRLGDVIDETLMKFLREASHPRDDFGRENLGNEDNARHASWEDFNGRKKDSSYDHNDYGNNVRWKWDDKAFLNAEYDRQNLIFKEKVVADEAAAKRREETYRAEARARYEANHRFDKLEEQLQKLQRSVKDVNNQIQPVKKCVSTFKDVSAPAACKQLRRIRVHLLHLNKHVAFLKNEEILRKDAKLWVYEAIERSIAKLPWGLPQVVTGVHSIWMNIRVIYPAIAASAVFIHSGLTPTQYLWLLVLYHDDLIKPYKKKVRAIDEKAEAD